MTPKSPPPFSGEYSALNATPVNNLLLEEDGVTTRSQKRKALTQIVESSPPPPQKINKAEKEPVKTPPLDNTPSPAVAQATVRAVQKRLRDEEASSDSDGVAIKEPAKTPKRRRVKAKSAHFSRRKSSRMSRVSGVSKSGSVDGHDSGEASGTEASLEDLEVKDGSEKVGQKAADNMEEPSLDPKPVVKQDDPDLEPVIKQEELDPEPVVKQESPGPKPIKKQEDDPDIQESLTQEPRAVVPDSYENESEKSQKGGTELEKGWELVSNAFGVEGSTNDNREDRDCNVPSLDPHDGIDPSPLSSVAVSLSTTPEPSYVGPSLPFGPPFSEDSIPQNLQPSRLELDSAAFCLALVNAPSLLQPAPAVSHSSAAFNPEASRAFTDAMFMPTAIAAAIPPFPGPGTQVGVLTAQPLVEQIGQPGFQAPQDLLDAFLDPHLADLGVSSLEEANEYELDQALEKFIGTL